jgi:methyl-accepting chemotaxis protein
LVRVVHKQALTSAWLRVGELKEMSYKNWSLLAKVAAFLAVLGIGNMIGAGFSGYQLTRIDQSYGEILDGPASAAPYFARANRSVSDAITALYRTIAEPEAGSDAVADKEFRGALAAFDANVQQVIDATPAWAADVESFRSDMQATLSGVCAQGVRDVAGGNSGGEAAALAVMDSQCRPAVTDLQKRAVTINDAIIANMVERRAANTADAWMAMWTTLGSIVLLIVVVTGLAVLVLRRAVTAPIAGQIGVMRRMQSGDYAVIVEGLGRRDEIGSLAEGLEAFRAGLADAEAERRAQEEAKSADTAAVKRRAEMAERFVARMQELAAGFVRSSGEVADAAKNLSATAEETSRQAQAVAGAAEEASTNVETVAAGAEELSVSIREISARVGESSAIAQEAAGEAEASAHNVQTLSQSAQEIGEVVDLINNIAAQTNLLALNATIEAARAGDAGKGFAVVAAEVKQLADQTAKATEQISGKIGEIQSATNTTVEAISRIVATVRNIQQSSAAIASAVEEQGAATEEIAGNTQRAASGTTDVTNNIAGVGTAAEMTGSASTQLMSLSNTLRDQSANLQHEVSAFVESLRAA